MLVKTVTLSQFLKVSVNDKLNLIQCNIFYYFNQKYLQVANQFRRTKAPYCTWHTVDSRFCWMQAVIETSAFPLNSPRN